MAKKEKNVVERKWLNIKAKSKENNYDIEELDYLTCDLIAYLSQLTQNGITDIEGISIDTYKDRVWWVVEKIGLLPEYRSEDEELFDLDEEIIDKWEEPSDDFEVEIDDSKFYK
jgi:hypothetical protein